MREEEVQEEEDQDLGQDSLENESRASTDIEFHTKKAKKQHFQGSEKAIAETELEIMKSIHKRMEKRHQKTVANKKEPEKDDVDFFCLSIASEIRDFTPRERYMIKHDIREILCKYQMGKLNETPACHPYNAGMPGSWNFLAGANISTPRPSTSHSSFMQLPGNKQFNDDQVDLNRFNYE